MLSTLDRLLITGDTAAISPLQKIKFNPSKPSNNAMTQRMEKLDLIEETGVFHLEIGWVNPNYQRTLYHQVRNSSVDKLREMLTSRRYLALVCNLHQAWRERIDQAVDMYSKLLERQKGTVDRHLDEELKGQRRALNRVVQNYTGLGSVLLDPEIDDADLRACLLVAVSEDELRQDQSQFANWTKGDSKGQVYELASCHGSLNRFAAHF